MPGRVGCGVMQALSGVRVLDFTRVLAGPHCTMVLADLGADVIKVERPGAGDDTRRWGPPFLGGDAAYYLALNRNKRSVALDFDDGDDRDLLRRLAAGADVIVENFRPGVLDRAGLGWEDLRGDGVVYCSIPAFGPGPRADEPGYDIVVQALTGFMSITGDPSGEPAKIGVALLDLVTGLYAAIAVQAALETRRRTGESQRVIVPLFDSAVAALANQAANHLIGGIVPRPMGTAHPNLVPYQAFAAADGFVVIAAATDAQFRRLCDTLGLEGLGADRRLVTNPGRVTHREVVVAAIAAVVATRTVDHWVEACHRADVPAAPVRDLAALFAAPETAGLVEEITDSVRGKVRLVRSPMTGVGAAPSSPPPLLGEHTAAVRTLLWER
ncbi:MAG: CoA transferase [Acidimicrobiia bacterium]|nr:CoA transferase [Acidimicrobiia bacterium]